MGKRRGSRGGRRGPRRRRPKSWRILGRSVEEMNERFGPATSRSDRVLVWTEGKDPTQSTILECLMTADGARVLTARIVPPVRGRMSRDELLRTVGRYNGGHVDKPEEAPHELAGGAGALRFQGDHWAFTQRDPIGNVYGIKIWTEPLEDPAELE